MYVILLSDRKAQVGKVLRRTPWGYQEERFVRRNPTEKILEKEEDVHLLIPELRQLEAEGKLIRVRCTRDSRVDWTLKELEEELAWQEHRRGKA